MKTKYRLNGELVEVITVSEFEVHFHILDGSYKGQERIRSKRAFFKYAMPIEEVKDMSADGMGGMSPRATVITLAIVIVILYFITR